jgi:hypothetical protein
MGKLGIWSAAETAEQVVEEERKMACALRMAQLEAGQFPVSLHCRHPIPHRGFRIALQNLGDALFFP